MAEKKSKQPAAPPTVLVITLEPDGNGSLLARRGELAHLRQFTYNGLTEIVTAIQQGATALIDVEANPPVIDVPTTPAISSAPESEADTKQVEADELTTAPPSMPQPDALAIPSDP
jgi:hypothetical protein